MTLFYAIYNKIEAFLSAAKKSFITLVGSVGNVHILTTTSLSELLDFLVRKVNQSLKGNPFGVTFFDVGFDPT